MAPSTNGPSGVSTTAATSASKPNPPVMKSQNQCIKEGWGSWPNFMHSYQLKPSEADDVAQGKQILDAMRRIDYEEAMRKYQEQNAAGQ